MPQTSLTMPLQHVSKNVSLFFIVSRQEIGPQNVVLSDIVCPSKQVTESGECKQCNKLLIVSDI